ncbi:MAG: ComEC/Rec2 family competence protein [Chitinophagales bacterium]
MNQWNQYPFVRILLAFVIGVLIQLITGFHFPEIAIFILALIVIVLLLFIFRSSEKLFHYGYWIGLLMQVLVLMLGNFLAYQSIDTNSPNHYTHFMKTGDHFLVRIVEPPIEKEKSYKAEVEIKAVADSGKVKPSCGHAIIYFKKDSASAKLRYGDELIMKNNFQLISPPKNPDEFDYKKYAAYKNIYATAFLNYDDYHSLGVRKVYWIFQTTYWLREKSIHAIETYIPSTRESSVAEAMIIGDRDNLSFDVHQSFVDAGVIHIIVVAGLHVGILYLMLQKIFFFLDRRKQTRVVKSFLIVVLIWLFAFITGLSAPVLRAATMFSFMTLGKNIGRSIHPFNTLACSAFFILLFNPLLITEAGFQLSYGAVFGITTISSYIDKRLYRTNRVADYFWKIVAASTSAQIALFPFTLHYFNQFPVYFIPANVVVIPITFALVWLGVMLILLQWISPLALVIGKTMQGLLWFLNEFISCVQHAPLSVIHFPEFTWLQAILLALSFIFIFQFFISKRKSTLFTGLVSFAILLAVANFYWMKNANEKTFTVYSFPKKSRIEFREGNNAHFIHSTEVSDAMEDFYFRHRWQLQNVNSVSSYALEDSLANNSMTNQFFRNSSFFQFRNYKVAVIRGLKKEETPLKKLTVDAIIISGNPKIHIKNLTEFFNSSLIIFDSSNSFYRVKKWKEEAASLGIKTYDVLTEGAFVKQLN